MKYFIDTEFIEDFTRPWIGKTRHYIDLISIAIVAEDGREYYAISKDFDVDYVWSKYQLKPMTNIGGIGDTPTDKKEYWLRDNVLMPIAYELAGKDYKEQGAYMHDCKSVEEWFSLIKEIPRGWERIWRPRLKELIQKYAKHNRRIAEEIAYFVGKGLGKPEFYGYYADYDWVLFCSLYGRMLDLPSEFPMYCNDLKQMLEEKNAILKNDRTFNAYHFHSVTTDHGSGRPGYHRYQDHLDYPTQSNSHNALDDARWNKNLYDFLQAL